MACCGKAQGLFARAQAATGASPARRALAGRSVASQLEDFVRRRNAQRPVSMIARAVAAGTGAATGQIKRLGRTRLPEGAAPTVLKPSGYFAQIRDAMANRRSPVVIEGMMRQFEALPVLFTARANLSPPQATDLRIRIGPGEYAGEEIPWEPAIALLPVPSFTGLDTCDPVMTVRNGEPVYVYETGIGNAPDFRLQLALPRQWWLVRSAGGVGFVPAVNSDGTENFVITRDGPSGEIPFRRGPSGLPRLPATG